MELQNILMVDQYGGNIPMYIARFAMLYVVVFACPLCVLPCKDSMEELIWGGGEFRMNKKQNFLVTLFLICVSYVFALAIPNFGDALTILGATTNSGIGFLLPIMYYLRLEKSKPRNHPKKILCYLIFVFICISSIIELFTFVYLKIYPKVH